MYTHAKETTTIALGFLFKTAQVTQVTIVQIRLLKTQLLKTQLFHTVQTQKS
jgi:hypothetical protein